MKVLLVVILISILSGLKIFSQYQVNNIFGKWEIIDSYCILKYNDTIKKHLYTKTINRAKNDSIDKLFSNKITVSKIWEFLDNGKTLSDGYTTQDEWKIKNDSLILSKDGGGYLILDLDKTKMILGSLKKHKTKIVIIMVLKKVPIDNNDSFDKDEYYIIPYFKDFLQKMNEKVVVCE